MSPEQEALLRRLALNDADVAEATLAASLDPGEPLSLDPVTFCLARLAALIATDSALASYQWAVDAAFAAGATESDLVDVLVAVAPVVGAARVSSAAPELALALGYDVAEPHTG